MFDKSDDYRDEIFNALFKFAYHCIVVVDLDGNITHLNDKYCQFLNVKKEDAIGKHVTNIIENTRMHLVAKSGLEEIADLQYIRGNYMIANRIPIRSNDELVGAVGTVLFRDANELSEMSSHIKDLLLEIEDYRKQLQNTNRTKYSLHDIIGSSDKIIEAKEKIKKVAPSDVSVLLRGESGTGKELFAHSIHQLSDRHEKPFVKVNCGAIPEELIESELFGYKAGAFTGAKKGGKKGKFQIANGGTLFLDEIGDMPLKAQVKILRVIQEGEVEAIGAEMPEEVDVRIIAATNQDLEQLVKEKQFREDLYYRINVLQIKIPALRERKEDIKVLARYFLRENSIETGKRVLNFTSDVISLFTAYQWPGNVRQFENVIASAIHLTEDEYIKLDDLPDTLIQNTSFSVTGTRLKDRLDYAEKLAIQNALKETNHDRVAAAKSLGIGKSSLYEKIKKHNL